VKRWTTREVTRLYASLADEPPPIRHELMARTPKLRELDVIERARKSLCHLVRSEFSFVVAFITIPNPKPRASHPSSLVSSHPTRSHCLNKYHRRGED
jgi:hypothetical protein